MLVRTCACISIGLLALVVRGSWISWTLKRRNILELKEKFFEQNGGLMLQQQLLSYKGFVETAKIFNAEKLEKATNNYDKSRIFGQGNYETVYKGVLLDNKVVAIKKSKISDQSQIVQFINEVIVLTQINHRNVVKLLGCLEIEVSLLFYEFITNGTLFGYIHNKSLSSSLSWEKGLKIAAETVRTLAYLHFSTSMPIIHRDVKTTNILLDNNYMAKVYDFGASRLVPLNQSQLITLVQGTFGYLDPEYFHTSQLTEKSDVYSFGVVIAELLTENEDLSFNRTENDRNLAMYFVSAIKEDRLLQILEDNVHCR
jgi:serine/threonine protein kinase